MGLIDFEGNGNENRVNHVDVWNMSVVEEGSYLEHMAGRYCFPKQYTRVDCSQDAQWCARDRPLHALAGLAGPDARAER